MNYSGVVRLSALLVGMGCSAQLSLAAEPVKSVSASLASRFYQKEMCGPVALYLACRVAGVPVSMQNVRRETGFDGKSSSLRDLTRAAEKFGLEARTFQLDVRALADFGGPGIVNYPVGHFCVFLGWSPDGKVRIGDYPGGFQTLDENKFAERWGGHLITLQKSRSTPPRSPLPKGLPQNPAGSRP
jgi:ABC-type bacteriocin/lantibiotic exporter with double-glycine peptidase domain